MYSFSITDPSATPVLTINMVNRIPPGVTIISATAQCAPASGTDPEAASLVGAVSINGANLAPNPVNVQWNAGGKSGLSYLVTVLCACSDGNTYTGSGIMPIRKGGL
jgi:hypothetical protein